MGIVGHSFTFFLYKGCGHKVMENLIRSAVAENYDPAIQLEGSGPSITGNSQPLSQDSSEVHTNLIDIEKLFSKMLEALKTSGNGKKSLRKPFSAWLIFSQFQREHVLKDKPQLSFQEVSKTLGEMYHALSAEEMQRYVDLAKLDKERYLKDLDEEKAKFGDNSANGQASSQEQGDLIIPLVFKLSIFPYFKFMKQILRTGESEKNCQVGL